jgi:hypothetical protein
MADPPTPGTPTLPPPRPAVAVEVAEILLLPIDVAIAELAALPPLPAWGSPVSPATCVHINPDTACRRSNRLDRRCAAARARVGRCRGIAAVAAAAAHAGPIWAVQPAGHSAQPPIPAGCRGLGGGRRRRDPRQRCGGGVATTAAVAAIAAALADPVAGRAIASSTAIAALGARDVGRVGRGVCRCVRRAPRPTVSSRPSEGRLRWRRACRSRR